MREILERIARIFGCMDAVEFAIPAILAALVMLVAPLLLALHFFNSHHILAASVSFVLWVLAAIACIRDLHRRHFGWVSVMLGVVWFVTTLIIWWRLETT